MASQVTTPPPTPFEEDFSVSKFERSTLAKRERLLDRLSLSIFHLNDTNAIPVLKEIVTQKKYLEGIEILDILIYTLFKLALQQEHYEAAFQGLTNIMEKSPSSIPRIIRVIKVISLRSDVDEKIRAKAEKAFEEYLGICKSES